MDNLELLERLGRIEPPDLGVSARVAAAIEGAVSSDASPLTDDASREVRVHATIGHVSALPWMRLRRQRRAAIVVVSLAAVVVAIAFIVPVLTQSAPKVSAPTGRSTHGAFRLVDAASFPFHVMGGGANAVQLDCPTSAVCYSLPNGPVPTDEQGRLEKSTDGGATWQPTAPLPGNIEGVALTDSSCVSDDVCALVAQGGQSATTGFALTIDGGATWREVPVPLPTSIPGASLAAVSCVDASRCLVYVSASSSGLEAPPFGTFLSTTNGGTSWSTASSVPATANGPVWELRCDADASCIAITVPGSVAAPGGNDLSIQTLRSKDFGATWTVTAAPSSVRPGPGVLLVSCGDSFQCLAAYPSSTTKSPSIEIASTADGGATWQVGAAPSGWGDIAIAVSCDASDDCWVSSSTAGGDQGSGDVAVRAAYADPIVAVTHDGGNAWSNVDVPEQFNDAPAAVVGALSCPTVAGCVAIGANQRAFTPPAPSSTPAGAAAALVNSRVVLSNIAGATAVPS